MRTIAGHERRSVEQSRDADQEIHRRDRFAPPLEASQYSRVGRGETERREDNLNRREHLLDLTLLLDPSIRPLHSEHQLANYEERGAKLVL